MSVEILGYTGLQSLSRGTKAQPGLSRLGSMLVQDDLRSLVDAGKAFAVCNQTGVTSQAGLSATTPVLTLYNPSGSGVVGKLWYASTVFEVAFAAAASVWLAAGTNTVASAVTGTLTVTHRNLRFAGSPSGGNGSQGNRVVPILAATLPAAPVAIDLLGVGMTGAITTVPASAMMGKWYNGIISIVPGTNISIQTSTASGASSMLCSYIWTEEDQ